MRLKCAARVGRGLAFALTVMTGVAVASFPMWAAEKFGPVPPIKVKPELAELGKRLFFDPRLSGDASTACASCHAQSQGWAFSDDLSRGYPASVHWRNSQTVVNAAYYGKPFWAGAAKSLESQAPSAARGAVDGNGKFTIGDVPPDKYVLKAWHGRLGEKKVAVEVKAGGKAVANFSY